MQKLLSAMTLLIVALMAFIAGLLVEQRRTLPVPALPAAITVAPLEVIGYDSPQLRLFLYANAPQVSFKENWISADPPEGVLRHCPGGQNP